MREILFRGKAVNREKGSHRTKYKNGDWVYGLITRLYDERFELLPAEMRNENGVSGIEIDYRTIGQYTGLTDKNGTKIFEGDIVKIPLFVNCKEQTVAVVVWNKLYANFGLEAKKVKTDFYYYFGDEMEIIGNIHDNPELLNGGAKD